MLSTASIVEVEVMIIVVVVEGTAMQNRLD